MPSHAKFASCGSVARSEWPESPVIPAKARTQCLRDFVDVQNSSASSSISTFDPARAVRIAVAVSGSSFAK